MVVLPVRCSSFASSAALLVCPFSCCGTARYGFAISGHTVNGLGLAYSALVMVPLLYTQPPAAFFFTFFRALLFTFVGSFNTVVFGPKSVGRIAGLVYTTSAFFILLQTPLVNFTANQVRRWYLQCVGACRVA